MTAATAPPIPRSSTSRNGSPTGGCAGDATSPTPTDMPDRRLRAVAYIRESTEEQGQASLPTHSARASGASRPRTTSNSPASTATSTQAGASPRPDRSSSG